MVSKTETRQITSILGVSTQDKDYDISKRLEVTNNCKGCMYLQVEDHVDEWIDCNRGSSKPLLDIGCAYGVHTLRALKKGRNVVSLDMDSFHLEVLRENVQSSTHDGKLIKTIEQTMPCQKPFDVLEKESISACLLSEVLHFSIGDDTVKIMSNIYDWLEPSGELYISVSSASEGVIEGILQSDQHEINGGKTVEEIQNKLNTLSNIELVNQAVTFVKFGQTYYRGVNWLRLLSVQELKALCEITGFEEIRYEYHSPRKYPFTFAAKEECALLIARKPS